MSGPVHLVISAIGTDRPGIVEAISEFLLSAGANIEESRMAVLGGEFGVLLLASAADGSAQRIEQEIESFAASKGLQAQVKRTSARREDAEFGPAYHLTGTSLDHPGIVNRVSGLLARLGVNIQSAECIAQQAPESGAPVFHLEMQINLPPNTKLDSLHEELAQLGRAEGIDLDLTKI